jgi:hypothetical protein
MYLSDFDKEIIQAILNKKCITVDSFLLQYGDLEKKSNNNVHHMGNYYEFQPGTIIYVPRDPLSALAKLRQFLSLWDKLEKLGLIYTTSTPPKGLRLFPVFTADLQPNQDFLSSIHKFHEKEIVAFYELQEFISRGYLTEDEYYRREENSDRKKAQYLTIAIAVISILATIITTIFQYYTYTNEHYVYIKNAQAFQDTAKVRIVNTQSIVHDTVFVKKK